MTDSYRTHARSLTSLPEHGRAILPDDAADLPQVTCALRVGGASFVVQVGHGLPVDARQVGRDHRCRPRSRAGRRQELGEVGAAARDRDP